MNVWILWVDNCARCSNLLRSFYLRCPELPLVDTDLLQIKWHGALFSKDYFISPKVITSHKANYFYFDKLGKNYRYVMLLVFIDFVWVQGGYSLYSKCNFSTVYALRFILLFDF